MLLVSTTADLYDGGSLRLGLGEAYVALEFANESSAGKLDAKLKCEIGTAELRRAIAVTIRARRRQF